MENIDKMITLCESMINFNKNSESVFADLNRSIWESKNK